jgi:hypothetical protein
MNSRLPLVVPVTDVRDSWDWLVIWCTVGADVLALAAIVLSIFLCIYTIRRTSQANARERRNAFELEVLARLIEACGYNLPGSARVLQGLLGVLPEEDVLGIREEAKHGRVPSSDALAPFMAEFREAVDRRLKDH